MSKKPDFTASLSEMDSGIIESLLGAYLAEAAMGAIQEGKPGKVILSITLKQIEKSQQVSVAHHISYSKPTPCGDTTETHKTSTPMHVNTNGHLGIVPEKIDESVFKEIS